MSNLQGRGGGLFQRKLGVEVVGARDLPPKDAEGAASTFVSLCVANQKYQTTTIQSELNPVWHEIFVFDIPNPDSGITLEAQVYHREKANSRSLLGTVSLNLTALPTKSYSDALEEFHTLVNRDPGAVVNTELGLKVFVHHILAHQPKVDSPCATPEVCGNDYIFSSDLGDETITPEDTLVTETNPYLGGGHVVRGRFESADRPATDGYDLVKLMHYLFVRVEKAKLDLDPKLKKVAELYAEAKIGRYKSVTKHYQGRGDPVWNEVLVFPKNEILSSSILEVNVKVHDHHQGNDDLVGYVQFDVCTRVPVDSRPLDPTAYQIRNKEGEEVGELMLTVWFGTQADEAFQNGWDPDYCGSAAVNPHMMRSKVYYSPKLWYVRVDVDRLVVRGKKVSTGEVVIRVNLGEQCVRTSKGSQAEDLLLVATEPFDDQSLIVSVTECREPPDAAGEGETLGSASISLNSVEKRYDYRTILAKWYDLSASNALEEEQVGRICISVCIEGGYQVFDEPPNSATADLISGKQLQDIGGLDLGIINASELHPPEGKSAVDSYCVAKCGHIWYRTRTIKGSPSPEYNEPFRWQVYDPATTLTVAVFDNTSNSGKQEPIGRVWIPISTLESGRVYTLSYPLLTFGLRGLQKRGKLHLAVRFTCTSLGNSMLKYSQPLLPEMHYVVPLPVDQQKTLYDWAVSTVAARLGEAEPPLAKEVVKYICFNKAHHSSIWSFRTSKANFLRVMSAISALMGIAKWFREVCMWKNAITTAQVHVLFVMLVCNPTLILPTIFLYVFVIGLWKYRNRPRLPPCVDGRISQAHSAHQDETDEEFDSFPSSRTTDIVRMRYDRLRSIAARVQTVVGDIVIIREKIEGLISWRDPRASFLFIIFCLVAAILLYMTPFKAVLIVAGVYFMRHPRYRSKVSSIPLNFFRRLPSRQDYCYDRMGALHSLFQVFFFWILKDYHFMGI